MKALLKNTKFLICFLVLVATVCITIGTITLTSSSYVTSVNQYAAVATTTPAKLNGEVKLSFYYSKDDDEDLTKKNTDDILYVNSSYASTSGKTYAMKIENRKNITDYFDTPISTTNALEFFDFFGTVKSDSSYGALSDYTMPLVTEWTVGSGNDGDTTLTISPFSDKVTVTIYFSLGYKLKNGSSYIDRTSPYSAFYFNGKEIVYDTSGSTTSDGLTKCDNNTSGAYTFTAASKSNEQHKSSQELYMYTTTVGAEEAINISTATQSQAMIFLVSLSPASDVDVYKTDDTTKADSGYVTYVASGNGDTVSLTATATVPDGSGLSSTGSWTSSNTSVASLNSSSTAYSTTSTTSDGYTTYTYTNTISVTNNATGTAQITFTMNGATSVYTIYVTGVAIKNSAGNVVTSAYVYLGLETTFTADLYSSSTSTASYTWSLENVSSTGCVSITSGTNSQTVTLTGSESTEGTATLKVTCGDYTATCAITVAKLAAVDATANVTTLVEGDEDSSGTLTTGTYSTDILLYQGDDGTTVIAKATSDNTVSISKSTKTIDGLTFKYVLKTGGTGSATARSIQITTVDTATITVYMVSSGSSDRTVNLYDSEYKTTDTSWTVTGTLAAYTATSVPAGTYYIGSASGGLNVYYIKIDYPETGIAVADTGSNTSASYTATATASSTASITLTATLTNLSGYTLNWTSNNENIATVSSTGDTTATVTVYTTSAGTATITVTAGVTSYSATYVITVQDSISLASSATIYAPAGSGTSVGNTATLSATSTTDSITWTSLDESIVTVSGSGKTATITGVAAGTATITATTASGSYATCEVTVANLLTLSEAVTVGVGDTNTVTVTVASGTASSYSWSLENTTYATISSGGSSDTVTLSGSTAGTVTLTITVTMSTGATYTATCTVTVTKLISANTTVIFVDSSKNTIPDENNPSKNGVTVSSASYKSSTSYDFSYSGTSYIRPLKMDDDVAITFTLGTAMTLEIYIQDKNGIRVDGVDLTGTSTTVNDVNFYIVTVALSAGEHKIVKSSGYEALLSYITFTTTPASKTVATSGTVILNAILTSDMDYTYTWVSSNDSVATVDKDSKVLVGATVTGVVAGTVTITVTATKTDSTTYSATYTITVTAASG